MSSTPTTNKQTDPSTLAMSLLGISHIAYIRPVVEGFAVCAADGTQLAVFATHEAAYYSARQYDLDPVSIH